MGGARPRAGEFARIARYFAPLAAEFPGAFGLTDDAAVLAPRQGIDLVVTTDTIVAGVHYIGDESPDDVAAKLMRVNLSDLAAKGAVPLAYMLNVALPDEVDDAWVAAFAGGLARDQATFAIHLIGGDSVATPGPLTLSLTAFGEIPAGAMIRRSGARSGDRVFVTGTIGDGALGLAVARGSLDGASVADREFLLGRYRRPEPRSGVGPRLVGLASASLDVSDGLIADLGHIAETSGVAITVEAARVPLSSAARAALDKDSRLLPILLGGGDDYELAFTAPEHARAALARLVADTGVAISEIGSVSAGSGSGVSVLDPSGQPVEIGRAGYTHG